MQITTISPTKKELITRDKTIKFINITHKAQIRII